MHLYHYELVGDKFKKKEAIWGADVEDIIILQAENLKKRCPEDYMKVLQMCKFSVVHFKLQVTLMEIADEYGSDSMEVKFCLQASKVLPSMARVK